MIDILVDDALGCPDDAAADEAFKPPQGIEAAVHAAYAVAGYASRQANVCIRFTTNETIRKLNRQWRHKDAVTDVLSFPMQDAPFDVSESLGDIALAAPFIRQEADRLGLPVEAHVLHLIIHAMLHLLGFDHLDDAGTARMQGLEIEAMQGLQLHHPYPAEHTPVEQS